MSKFRWGCIIVGLILFSTTTSFGAAVYGNAVDANNAIVTVGNQAGNKGTADGGLNPSQHPPVGLNGATSNSGSNLGGQGAQTKDDGGDGGGGIAAGMGNPNGIDAQGGGGTGIGGLFPDKGGKISADGNSIGGGGSLDINNTGTQGGGAGGIVGALVGGGGGGSDNVVLSGGGGGGVDMALYQVGGGGGGGTPVGTNATGGQGIVGATIRTIRADMDASAYGGNTSSKGGGAGAALGGQVLVSGGSINTDVLAMGVGGDILPNNPLSTLSNGGAGAGAGGKIQITGTTINGNLFADGIAGHIYANLAGGAGAGAGGAIDLNNVVMTGSLISLTGVGGIGSQSIAGAGGAARGGNLTFAGLNTFNSALTLNATAIGGDALSGAGAALGGNIVFLNSETTINNPIIFDVTGLGGDSFNVTSNDVTSNGEGRDGNIVVNTGATLKIGAASQLLIASSITQARSSTYRGSQATKLIFKSGSNLEVSTSRDPNVPVITKLGANAPDIIVENGAKIDVYQIDEFTDLNKPYLLTDIGDMTALTSENPFYNITMSLSGNNTYFSLDLLSFDTVNMTLKNPNGMVLYDNFDSMLNNPLTSKSLQAGILYITGYADDPAEFEKIVDSLTAEPYATAMIGKVSIHDEFRKQLNSPSTDSPCVATKDVLGNIFTIWANGIGFSAATSGSENLYGYDTSLYGFTAGASYKVDTLTYGVVAGYTHDRQDFNDLGSTLKSDGVHIGIFAEKTFGNLRTKLDMAYSHFSVDSERYIILTQKRAVGSPGQNVYSVGGRVAYDICLDAALISPYVTARYLHIGQDSFTETGAKDYGLRVDGTAYDSFTTGIGVVASKEFTTKSTTIKPELEVGYLHEWGQTNAKLNYQFIGSPVVVQARSLDADRDAFVLGGRVKIGLVNKSNYNVNLNLAYGAEFWGKTTAQTVYGGVEVGF